MEFLCNVCLNSNSIDLEGIHREVPSCAYCMSTSRQREICWAIEKISSEFEYPYIVGISDHPIIENFLQLRHRCNYTNTFFHQTPKLDISNPKPFWENRADILINSDVIEHTFFPLKNSLDGCRDIVRDGGSLILTAPWSEKDESVEYYPWMVSYRTIINGGLVECFGLDTNGDEHLIDAPDFHGGPGNTLVTRKIELSQLLHELKQSGFTDIVVHQHDIPELGIRRTNGLGLIIAK